MMMIIQVVKKIKPCNMLNITEGVEAGSGVTTVYRVYRIV
jgi:hypothetical protein